MCLFETTYHHGACWLPGVIEQRTGPVSCKVRLEDGRIRRCHQDQVRNRFVEMPPESPTEFDTATPATVSSEPSTNSTESPTTNSGAASEIDKPSNAPPETTDAGTNNAPTETARTYSVRSRNPVDRFEPTW